MLKYEELSKERRHYFANELEQNPVLNHIISKLSNTYLHEMEKLSTSCAPHEIQGLFNAYKTAKRVEQDIKREIQNSLDKKPKK